MVSIRLSDEIEEKIEQIAENENLSKSDIIKEAIEMYLQKYSDSASPYELGKDFFGKYGSGKNNLSKDYKNIMREKLRAKHSH